MSDFYKKTESLNGETYHRFGNETGDALMTVHQVFPGIDLIYNSVHMDECKPDITSAVNIIEIQHCKEGRIEHQFEDEFFYLMPGDLSIAIRKQAEQTYKFPLRHYHGITITINTDIAPRCFSCFLKDVDVQPLAVAKKLCGDKNHFTIRSEEYIEHIFSELYAVPESYRIGYFKIKIMELLLVLSGINPNESKQTAPALSKVQVSLAKNASAHLAGNLDKRITVAELSRQFHVSQTHLQNAFKGVYGVPIYSYMRILKMNSAASLLINTSMSVSEIAGECGYDNGSKFASAFREIMGETPLEYRKAHRITSEK